MKLPEKILYAHEHTTIDLSGPKKNIDCRLDDFDATAAEYRRLAEHGVVGIVGRSGSGKSTLLKLLMRFWDADRTAAV